MQIFIAQRGELCLLTLSGYIALTESPSFLPVAQAPWAPESDFIVGYIEGEAIYRLLPADAWNDVLKAHRQKQVNAILDSLRQRGLYDGPSAAPQNSK